MTATRLAMLALVLALAAGTAACGKKSRLDPPDGDKSSFPKVYPRE
ncbi:MAG: hypothetical protein AB7P02_20915 [Alphaproteobacteria bacterium]